MAEPILIAKRGDTQCVLLPEMANRHGLISGATGTGKTITLQTLAENFSRLGVPVFMADVKGDLTGITQAGTPSRLKFSARVCSVIVLPVPVAPEISPWRFAISGSRTHSVSPRLAIRIGSAMLHCPK